MTGIKIENCEGVIITNCKITGAKEGIAVDKASKRVDISDDNIFISCEKDIVIEGKVINKP